MRSVTDSDRERLERAVGVYLRSCYRLQTAARASELAQHLGVAAASLSRLAHRIAGQPLHDYLRERQLAQAAKLLRATPLSMERIALASAFGTISTFYRCFVAAFGQTPATYRARFHNARARAFLDLPPLPLHPQRRIPSDFLDSRNANGPGLPPPPSIVP